MLYDPCPLAPAIVQSFNRAQLFILAAGLGEKRQPLRESHSRAQRRYRQSLSTVWEWLCQCWLSSRRRKASARLPVARDLVRRNAQQRGRPTVRLTVCATAAARRRARGRRSAGLSEGRQTTDLRIQGSYPAAVRRCLRQDR